MKRLCVALALLLPGCSSAPGPRVPATVRVEPYLGVDPALILEAPPSKIVAIALPETAGRIVHYSLGGENILWDNPDRASGKPRPGGGYGLDLGPERTIARHPVIWDRRHGWAKLDDVFSISSERDPAVGMRVEKQVAMDGATGALFIAQRMINVSDGERAYCFWDRTLCKAGGYTVIPLNPKSRFPAKWVIGKRKEVDGKVDPFWWEYNGDTPSHPNIRILDGMLVAKSQSEKEQKIGADSDGGWIAYARGRLLFVKYYPYYSAGNYIDNGLSVAHYFNQNLAELEPLSPVATLKPEGEYVFPERWTLTLLEREVTTHEEARAAASRIPASPFPR